MNLIFQKYKENKRNTWEQINLEAQNSTFLSSIEWIEFQKYLGKEIDQYFITLEAGGRKIDIGILYIEIFKRKLIKFAYSPYQPVILGEDPTDEEFEDLYLQIKFFMQKYIDENKLTLFRFDPLLPKNRAQNLTKMGFKHSLAPAQAKDVWEINLDQTEEQIRSGMSNSTRHNVNKTAKLGIEFVKAKTPNEVRAFSDLMNETTQRKGFGNYDYSYFQKQFDKLSPKGMMDIFLAKYGGRYLSGALINYYKDTAYYTHGASTSDRELSKLRSPYFLQWEIMKLQKFSGIKKYNMWGIIPGKKTEEVIIPDDRHKNKPVRQNPLQGVSDYKKSFGGYEISYIGPMEVYNKTLNYTLHKAIDWWIYRHDRY